MLYFSQVNLGLNPASLLGLLQIIFGLFYLIFVIFQLIRIGNRLSNSTTVFFIIQLFILPVFLLLSGLILIVQGWRLAPILQFQQLIISALVFYLTLKEIFINAVDRNR